jgi:hypothetical protein
VVLFFPALTRTSGKALCLTAFGKELDAQNLQQLSPGKVHYGADHQYQDHEAQVAGILKIHAALLQDLEPPSELVIISRLKQVETPY